MIVVVLIVVKKLGLLHAHFRDFRQSVLSRCHSTSTI